MCALPVPLVADIHFDYRRSPSPRLGPGIGSIPPEPHSNFGARASGCEVSRGGPRAARPSASARARLVGRTSSEKHGWRHHAEEDGPESGAGGDIRFTSRRRTGLRGGSSVAEGADVAMTRSREPAVRPNPRHPHRSHLGHRAGTLLAGTVKSAAGLGILLGEGIGDTIRVSLTADPVEEVRVARMLLKSSASSSAAR